MPKSKIIPAVEARTHLGDIMKQVIQKGTHFIINKSGINMVAIISANEYSRIIEEREERFNILNKIKANAPDVGIVEAEKDVSKAVAAIRKKKNK